MYPEYAEINGKEYKIDTDYKTALKCFEIINDNTIYEEEKILAIIYLLFDFIPEKEKDIKLFFEKAVCFLQCGKTHEEQNKNKKDMDFFEDKGYIVSSFMSDYHIDLSKTNLHFWQFIDLIEGLTDGSILNRVRNLRNYDVSQIKDTKERQKMIKAKEQVALKESKKENHLTKEQEKSMEELNKILGL